MPTQNQDDHDSPSSSQSASKPCTIEFGYLGRPAKYTRHLFEGSSTKLADGESKFLLFIVEHEEDDQIDVRFPKGATARTAGGDSISLERRISDLQRRFWTIDQRLGFPRSPSSHDYCPMPGLGCNDENGLTATWYKKDIEGEDLGVFVVFGRASRHIHPGYGHKKMPQTPTCSVRVEWGNCWMTVSRELRSEYSDALYDTIISLKPTTKLPRSTIARLPNIPEEQE
ncbi:uncharacterized protein BDZ99DRAFT_528418 [Mytilinidion resinicola]|uniref:Uncharacterized protein n=1 Tax=Mytilinidion resinicola TaxID=574789 RepID=A0A6A6Y0X6_9PEZI|nr:uncharacterized protein BDZ99DRAFT_528418 [Mytilinidion resinicola]KAF2801467.1 hypothetical protein BDZ99DRAFT_528418 [Mytilinidion resinicola]